MTLLSMFQPLTPTKQRFVIRNIWSVIGKLHRHANKLHKRISALDRKISALVSQLAHSREMWQRASRGWQQTIACGDCAARALERWKPGMNTKDTRQLIDDALAFLNTRENPS